MRIAGFFIIEFFRGVVVGVFEGGAAYLLFRLPVCEIGFHQCVHC